MFSLSGLDGSRGEKTEKTEKHIKETIKLKQKALFFRKFDYGRLRGEGQAYDELPSEKRKKRRKIPFN